VTTHLAWLETLTMTIIVYSLDTALRADSVLYLLLFLDSASPMALEGARVDVLFHVPLPQSGAARKRKEHTHYTCTIV